MLLMKYLVELGFKIRFESVEKYKNQNILRLGMYRLGLITI